MNETFAYILIVVAAFMCSCQFLFQRRYNKTEGADMYAAMMLLLIGAVFKIVSAFAIYGFEHTFTWGSAILSLVAAYNAMRMAMFSAKVFLIANMSVYSMFMMLGGMALPFIFGLCVGERLTVGKILCFVLIAVAMLINTDLKSKSSRAAIKYYITIFICNGLSGALSAANRSLPVHSPSGTFLMMIGIWTLLISGIVVVVQVKKTKRKVFVAPKNALVSAALYGGISSLSSLFILIALETLDASVQYPMITGGTMVFSALICFVRGEKLTVRDLIAVVIATVSSVVVIL